MSKKTVAVGTKARQMENTAHILDVNKVKNAIANVKPSNITVEDVKWAHNLAALYVILLDIVEQTDCMDGRRVMTGRDHAVVEIRKLAQAGIDEVKCQIGSRNA